MRRRPLLQAALLVPCPALAQASRPVRLVLPFPAGGPTDALARLMAPLLAARLEQPVVVDNRPGGGGVPAAEHVMRAAPDGLTLLFTTNSTHSTGPALQTHLWSEAQALHHAGTHALDQQVGPLAQAQHGLHGDRILEIQHHGLLAAAGDGMGPFRRGQALRRLDGDDGRPQVGQQHAAERTGSDAADFDHFDACEWAHAGAPC